jgi:K+-transporting ATPase ATPase A chain
MTQVGPALGQIGVLLLLLAVTVPCLGRYLAHVYTSERHLAVERATYRVLRVDPDADQHRRSYAMSVLGFPALPADGAWNTAVSFVTNTN